MVVERPSKRPIAGCCHPEQGLWGRILEYNTHLVRVESGQHGLRREVTSFGPIDQPLLVRLPLVAAILDVRVASENELVIPLRRLSLQLLAEPRREREPLQ